MAFVCGVEVDDEHLFPELGGHCFGEPTTVDRRLRDATLQINRGGYLAMGTFLFLSQARAVRSTENGSRREPPLAWEIRRAVAPIGHRLPGNLRHFGDFIDADEVGRFRSVVPCMTTVPRVCTRKTKSLNIEDTVQGVRGSWRLKAVINGVRYCHPGAKAEKGRAHDRWKRLAARHDQGAEACVRGDAAAHDQYRAQKATGNLQRSEIKGCERLTPPPRCAACACRRRRRAPAPA